MSRTPFSPWTPSSRPITRYLHTCYLLLLGSCRPQARGTGGGRGKTNHRESFLWKSRRGGHNRLHSRRLARQRRDPAARLRPGELASAAEHRGAMLAALARVEAAIAARQPSPAALSSPMPPQGEGWGKSLGRQAAEPVLLRNFCVDGIGECFFG